MRLKVGNTNCVGCPIRGEVSVNTCAVCPLLTRLRTRAGHTVVVCRGTVPYGLPDTAGGWLASRALTGRY